MGQVTVGVDIPDMKADREVGSLAGACSVHVMWAPGRLMGPHTHCAFSAMSVAKVVNRSPTGRLTAVLPKVEEVFAHL